MNNNMMKLLLIAGGIFAVGFGIFIAGSRFYEGITERSTQLESLQLEDGNLTSKLTRLQKQKKEVDNWRAISMPGDLSSSSMMYKGFLQEMMLKHKFTLKSFADPNRISTGGRQGAAPPTSHISYDVVFESTLDQLLRFLQEFYAVNVPHLIKNIAIEPLGRGAETKLSVTMKVDVLAMSNTTIRHSVMANPTATIALLESMMAMKRLPGGLLFGLSQLTQTGLFGNSRLASKAKPDREYATMLQKNVFAGLAPRGSAQAPGGPKQPDKDILKFTQLTSITANNVTEEALLRVRKTNKYVKLRAEGGVNDFEIRDGENTLVLKGKVLAIKPRDLVFEWKGKAYLLHIGEFVEEALKKELTTEELKQHEVVLSVNDQN